MIGTDDKKTRFLQDQIKLMDNQQPNRLLSDRPSQTKDRIWGEWMDEPV